MTSVSRYVLGIRKIGGWLKMTEDAFGKDFAERCERYDDALIEGEKMAERYYYETERVSVRTSIREWIAEMSDFAEECRARRRKELEETVSAAKSKLAELMQHRGEIEKKKELLSGIKTLERKLETEITDDDIERARNFPIENLIKVGRNGMALCIGHDDKRPSMNCKNNFAYCHSCGFHADTIGMYMKINNANFVEAVKALS